MGRRASSTTDDAGHTDSTERPELDDGGSSKPTGPTGPSGPAGGDAGGTSDASNTWSHVTLDFDELASSIDVSTTYSSVTFSSPTGVVKTESFSGLYGGSSPNYIYAGPDREGDFALAFPRPARAVRFSAIAVNDTGAVANIKIYEAGVLVETQSLQGKGDQNTPVVVDLGTHTNISRIEITGDTDYLGFGLDDLSFDLRD